MKDQHGCVDRPSYLIGASLVIVGRENSDDAKPQRQSLMRLALFLVTEKPSVRLTTNVAEMKQLFCAIARIVKELSKRSLSEYKHMELQIERVG